METECLETNGSGVPERPPFSCSLDNMGVLDTLNGIPWFPDVAVTLATVFLLVGVYLLVLQPRILITKRTRVDQPCPDRWEHDPKTNVCRPLYRTSCTEFRADDPNLQSLNQQCEFAKNCGTNWGGFCE